ncbi:MAG: primosomal protein N', partial [Bacteriovoracaceae bacterium]|nr:primosomal protein N' [Bacteriovoracaceae bacterium]
MTKFYTVAVNSPFNKGLLTYSYVDDLKVGSLVQVPLGKRKERGCVLRLETENPNFTGEIKSIIGVETQEILIDQKDLELFEWLSQYYHYSLGQLIFDILPKILKRPRKLKYYQGKNEEFEFTLTSEQIAVFEKLKNKNLDVFSQSLLHGITGSGKTIVYLKIILEVLQKNKSILFLLPEINLTPQFTEVFEKYLSVPIYTYHSELSSSDRYGLWKLLQEDHSPKLVLGVRSAVFLPINNLGLIVVDEEHDNSFKQEDRFTYHGRDVAIKKASLLKIPIILGSATPSLETYMRFYQTENYYELKNRIGSATLPAIELIDVLAPHSKKGQDPFWPLHEKSLQAIDEALKKKEQVLVFLNRLGFAHHIQCRSCAHYFDCPNCTSHLRYYKEKQKLFCQYCTFDIPIPEQCPKCQSLSLLQKGFGTEKVHEVLSLCFQQAKIARFDRDEIKTFTELKERLQDFHEHKIDIMVGTQMLSKGHNFKRVNLVLILGIDAQLHSSDFRAEEKIFQMITQVAGRSGRFGDHSKVLIQTLNSESEVFLHAQKGSLNSFYEKELERRKIVDVPPYAKVISLYFHSRFQERAMQSATLATDLLTQMITTHFGQVKVMGPRPSLMEKRAGMYS